MDSTRDWNRSKYNERSAILRQSSRQVETKQGDENFRCMISFAIGSIGAAGAAGVSDGLIGESGGAMRLSMREGELDGETNER